MIMKKLFITLLIVGVASFMGYALLSGEHNSSDNIDVQEKATNIADRLQAEIAKANTDNASNAILRIGYSVNVEVQFEQMQNILRVINDALPNANLVWEYDFDDKLPDGHCSILLLIG